MSTELLDFALDPTTAISPSRGARLFAKQRTEAFYREHGEIGFLHPSTRFRLGLSYSYDDEAWELYDAAPVSSSPFRQ